MGRCRAIVKDMAKVATAASTENLSPDHAERAIADLGDIFWGERPVEAGPAGAGVELRAGGKERQAATGTEIDAFLVVIEQVAAEGRLGPLGPQNPVGGGAKLLLPLGIGLYNTGTLDDRARIAIRFQEADGDGVRISRRSLCGHEADHRKQQGRGQEMTKDHAQTIAQKNEKCRAGAQRHRGTEARGISKEIRVLAAAPDPPPSLIVSSAFLFLRASYSLFTCPCDYG